MADPDRDTRFLEPGQNFQIWMKMDTNLIFCEIFLTQNHVNIFSRSATGGWLIKTENKSPNEIASNLQPAAHEIFVINCYKLSYSELNLLGSHDCDHDPVYTI